MTGFLDRVVGDPRVYDLVQRTLGLERLRRRVRPFLETLETGSLLDVGAGTANFLPVIPAHLEYLALDVDPLKLAGLRSKHPAVQTILASGTSMPLADASVDHALCVDVSHHLPDDELGALFAEIARVVRRTLVFVDALKVPRVASRLLWGIDRGSHPRPLETLRASLAASFDVTTLETFTIHHSYVLVVATPRDGRP